MARVRLPKSVREAEAAIAAQEAAEQSQAVLQTQQQASIQEQSVEETQAQQVEQAPTEVAQPQEQVPDEREKEITELKAQIKVLKEEHSVAQEQASYYKQRWDTLAGIHKKQVDDVQQQNKELKVRNSQLEEMLKSVPQADEDLIAVKRDLGDKADEYSDEYLAQMAKNRKIAREAAESRFAGEINELRKKVASIDSSSTIHKSNEVWDKVESIRPGVTAAIEDFYSGMKMWLDDKDKPSDKMTRKQRMELYTEMGDIDKIVAIIDQFARLTKYKFSDKKDTESSVEIPPQSVKPTSGQALVTNVNNSHQTASAPKSRFPQAFAHELTTKWSRMSAGAFKPFTISAGGKTVSFTTRSQAMKMALECEDALENDRVF